MNRRTLLLTLLLAFPARIALAQGSLDAEARAHFEAAAIAYDGGRYESALAGFERAHALSGRPELLYNIGLTAERLRDDDRALEAYRRYLAEVPNGTYRESVEARIAVLEREIAERDATEARLREAEARANAERNATATTHPSESESGANGPRIALVTSGTALLAGAVGTGAWWAIAGRELDRCRGVDAASAVCTNESTLDARRTAALGTTVSLAAVGAALLVTGLVVSGEDEPAPRVACAPVGVGVVCAGRFH